MRDTIRITLSHPLISHLHIPLILTLSLPLTHSHHTLTLTLSLPLTHSLSHPISAVLQQQLRRHDSADVETKTDSASEWRDCLHSYHPTGLPAPLARDANTRVPDVDTLRTAVQEAEVLVRWRSPKVMHVCMCD